MPLKCPALLQDAHHLLPLLELLFPFLLALQDTVDGARAPDVNRSRRLPKILARVNAARKESPALLQAVGIQHAADVEEAPAAAPAS